MSQGRTPGFWWFWQYKDALMVGADAPQFELQGKKKFIGRHTSSSSQFSKSHPTVLCFLPGTDAESVGIAQQFADAMKHDEILSNHRDRIHFFVGVRSLEEFDEVSKEFPVQLWADIDSSIARKFGLMRKSDSVGLQGNGETLCATFVLMKDRVIKSPAYQPKYQTVNLAHIKNTLRFLDLCDKDISSCTAADSYGAELTEEYIQNEMRDCWESYLEEAGLKGPNEGDTSVPEEQPAPVKISSTSSHLTTDSPNNTTDATIVTPPPPVPGKPETVAAQVSSHTVGHGRPGLVPVNIPGNLDTVTVAIPPRPGMAPVKPQQIARRGPAPTPATVKKPMKDELVTVRAARSVVALGMRSGGETRTRGMRAGPLHQPQTTGVVATRKAAIEPPRSRL